MSQSEKSAYYQELKRAGVQFEKEYRKYTTDELRAGVDLLREKTGRPSVAAELAAAAQHPVAGVGFDQPTFEFEAPAPYAVPEPSPSAAEQRPADTVAGVRQNTRDGGRLDDQGLIWYQDEIRKPAVPTPRARRVLKYVDPGVTQKTITDGNFLETFEVAGTGNVQAEVKITLPSYQVGLYRDPRFPFRIHIYNETRGFDFFDVQEYYGGAELVPDECKRMYVENVLCYDIRTVVRAIETEARRLGLAN